MTNSPIDIPWLLVPLDEIVEPRDEIVEQDMSVRTGHGHGADWTEQFMLFEREVDNED